ncbi:MAG: response regulator [Casimicrobiaceae bacterium]
MGLRRVLIVEDSPNIRQRISDDVSALGGLEVVGYAETAEEAIAAIEQFCPDVVVTDLALKAGSGLDIVRWTLTGPCPMKPHIVVLTNYAYPEYKRQCLTYGAGEFFDKTSEYSDFLSSMRKLS